MIRKMSAALLLIVLLYPASTSQALSCQKQLNVTESYKDYDGVLMATVDNILRKKGSKEVQLTVNHSYKGVQQETLQVGEDEIWNRVERGQDYLFFLKKTGTGWEHPVCSATKKKEEVTPEESAFLASKEIPIPIVHTRREVSNGFVQSLPKLEHLENSSAATLMASAADIPYKWMPAVTAGIIGGILTGMSIYRTWQSGQH
ncbi:hypothetical protein [Paenibacillus lutrae]|uniref:Uncharacterized protein n=1 Tax=Paenibacillus lutrae TaxID=2078573 RepID=A0A7X3K1E2_9BACL|nr:hypothetical protein [Paenibacillus lutrae]MVP01881.1 hypothetical protein [Paenibacillus lutrae]